MFDLLAASLANGGTGTGHAVAVMATMDATIAPSGSPVCAGACDGFTATKVGNAFRFELTTLEKGASADISYNAAVVASALVAQDIFGTTYATLSNV